MLGTLSVGIFVLLVVASFQRWIRQDILPLQSVLVLGAVLLVLLAILWDRPFRMAQLFSAATMHPITAMIAGFLLAGALEGAGAFVAAGRLLGRMSRGVLGLSGTVVLLISAPTLFAMPCGRVWAAALLPAAIMFGAEVARRQNNSRLLPAVVFGLIVNAAASCGPSPLGGIGMMAEGTAGYPMQAFSDSQQMAIIVMTLVAMAGIVAFSPVTVDPATVAPATRNEAVLPDGAYFSFLLYVIGLAAVFISEPPVPIQTILLAMTILVMIVGRVSFKSLLGGLMIHPVTAMVAGFIMAGALLVTGGFDALTLWLTRIAEHTPLGYIGVSVLVIYLPLIFPMPCGRILATALLPGVIQFGRQVVSGTGEACAMPAMLVAFIVCAAASCGPSPLGGIGGIGEGYLGQKAGVSAHAQQLAIFLGTPVASLIVTHMGLATGRVALPMGLLALLLGLCAGAAVNRLVGEPFYRLGGLLGGLLVGALILVL